MSDQTNTENNHSHDQDTNQHENDGHTIRVHGDDHGHDHDGDHGHGHHYPVCCFTGDVRLWIDANGTTVAVKDLSVGDELLVHTENNPAFYSKIKWIGTQVIDIGADLLTHAPIRIMADAFGISHPSVDILLSPDHAVLFGVGLVDGASILIQAGALVNDRTIVRDIITESFTYYHIEMECGHVCLYGNGIMLESFVDNVDRRVFDNWDGRAPTVDVLEMPYPRAKSQRQIPMNIRKILGIPVSGEQGLSENHKTGLEQLHPGHVELT